MKYLSNSRDCPRCGSNHKTKPFCVYENGVHCFSCGFTRTFDASFSIRESRIENCELPLGCKNNLAQFRLEHQAWLNQYYITQDHVSKYGIYELDDSLVFQLSENSYQQRWLNPRRFVTKNPKSPRLFSEFSNGKLVICEDFISAVRIAKHYDVLCLSGTKISFKELRDYTRNYNEVITWLDNDHEKEINSGQESAKIICNLLESVLQYNRRKFAFSPHGFKIRNISTEKDPKWYTDLEIRRLLS